MSNGKGSTPRPSSVDIETYKINWERTFKNTSEKTEVQSTAVTVEGIQEEINRLKDIIDNYGYSGSLSASSGEDHGEYL